MKLKAPQGKAVHSVGAGDSAVAAGSATAFSKTLCTQEEVEALLVKVQIQTL